MVTLVGLDARQVPALCRRLGIRYIDVAERAGIAPSEVSRALAAVTAGGTLERVLKAVGELVAEAEART